LGKLIEEDKDKKKI